MLHFFTKKYFIKDLLEGFVDIHCHILPGIDDGAANIDEAIALIKKFAVMGIDQFIATPHIMEGYYANNDVTIANAYEKLLESLTAARLTHIVIHPSAEYMIDSNFELLLEQRNIHPLKGKYVLVELSYLQPPINLYEIIERIRQLGFLPVLAHPERYSFYHKKRKTYYKLKQLGCFFQMNLLSLSEYYGKSVQKNAYHLLDKGLIDFVGTDTHNIRHLELLNKIHVSSKVNDKLRLIIRNTNETFSIH
ncbi:histidinol phosphatase [Flavobacteriaceae bacterium R38]|nr:histidinol phosphatase [Flavobacteriaceae bacterium R38]